MRCPPPHAPSSRAAAARAGSRAAWSSITRSTRSSTARAGPSRQIRWLFSTLSSAMIFDDHDVHDDWNSSQAWLEEARTKEWWRDHIVGALASYWVYQHIGNLRPELTPTPSCCGGAGGRGRWPVAARSSPARRTASRRQPLELLPRPRPHPRGRRLARLPRAREGRRSMVDEEEWEWLGAQATGASTTCWWAPRCRCCSRAGCTTSRRGTRRSAPAPRGGGRAARRAAAARPRPRALGGVRGVLPPPVRAAPIGGRGRARRAAGLDRDAVRRRAPCVPQRGGVRSRRGRA